MASNAPLFERNPRDYLGAPYSGWRLHLFVIVFESDTRAGRLFDLALMCLIVLSVIAVMLDSVASVNTQWGPLFDVLEWLFTVFFTIEYVLRLRAASPALCAQHTGCDRYSGDCADLAGPAISGIADADRSTRAAHAAYFPDT